MIRGVLRQRKKLGMKGIIRIPLDFEPPKAITDDQFFLEPLAPKHNDIDYDAWHSSVNELQGSFGPENEWPEENYSKEQNLSDLKRHYQEFLDNIAFTYTILKPSQEQCIGCLYIRPTVIAQYDVQVDLWFRTSHKYLETPFLQWLKEWLVHEWKFSSVAFPGREITWETYNQLVAKANAEQEDSNRPADAVD